MRSFAIRSFILLGLFFPALASISATAGAATIASYAGTYSGTFSGVDSGTWTTTISSIGGITATGNSSTSGAFTASGQVSSTGSLSMTAGSVSTGATFNGTINSATGAISGTWTDNGSGLGGTWSGSKAATASVSKTSQSISFGTAPTIVVGGTGTTSAAATSTLAVSLSSMTPSVCSVNNSTVTGITAGACIIAANQSGDANYNAAMQVTQSITIGVATAPAVSFSPISLTFAAQNTGTSSSAQTTTLSNTGSAVLNISSIAASGDYARTTTCGATLAAGASCTISITFAPTAADTRTGAVTVTSNAATSPSTISLSGTGNGGASTSNTPVALSLTTGWNLLGNSSAAPIDVAVTFGDPTKITTVWKWNKVASKWAFYAPSMTSSALTTYATNKGYDVLVSIDPKEGFWVNASTAVALSGAAASGVILAESDLQPGWNLVGSADNKTPSQLNQGLGCSLNAAGKSTVTAWAWDAPNKSWKFFAPALEAQGGTALADYITSKGYLPFSTALSASDGLWLNIGTASPTSACGSTTSFKGLPPQIIWEVSPSPGIYTYVMKLCWSPCTPVGGPVLVDVNLNDTMTVSGTANGISFEGLTHTELKAIISAATKALHNVIFNLWQGTTVPGSSLIESVFNSALANATSPEDVVLRVISGFTAAGFPAAAGNTTASGNSSTSGTGGADACSSQTYLGGADDPQVDTLCQIAQFDACMYQATGNVAYNSDKSNQCTVLNGLLPYLNTTWACRYCP